MSAAQSSSCTTPHVVLHQAYEAMMARRRGRACGRPPPRRRARPAPRRGLSRRRRRAPVSRRPPSLPVDERGDHPCRRIRMRSEYRALGCSGRPRSRRRSRRWHRTAPGPRRTRGAPGITRSSSRPSRSMSWPSARRVVVASHAACADRPAHQSWPTRSSRRGAARDDALPVEDDDAAVERALADAQRRASRQAGRHPLRASSVIAALSRPAIWLWNCGDLGGHQSGQPGCAPSPGPR